MKKYLPWIIVALVLIIGYVMYAASAPKTASANVTLATINNSGVSGVATLNEQNGSLIVTINATGGAAGVAMPAHIHAGVCPGVGAVTHPLNSVNNGISTTNLAGVTLESLKGMLPLAINVHKSATEASVYVACGTLSL